MTSMSICLVMIVKNESAIIARCLESLKNIINCYSICDTGSTDGTQEIIRRTLNGIPGDLHEVPWVNFGHNRTIGMQLARGKADYHLLIDADMTLIARPEFHPFLEADSYQLRFEGSCDYWVPRLVSDRHEWRYIGPTHEFICSETARTQEKLFTLGVVDHADGHDRPRKFQREINFLTKALEEEPENARHVFYLAQSYKDVGMCFQALELYAKRVEMGGWEEEVWYSLYQIARLKHQSAMKWPQVLEAYHLAYQNRPARLEPVYHIARHYRESGQFHLGYLYAKLWLETPYPGDILFIERGLYEYGLPLEYALCCQEIGKQDEAIRVSELLLANPDALPPDVREICLNLCANNAKTLAAPG